MNDQQIAAAKDTAANVCVAACPGSGKTTTLVNAVNSDKNSVVLTFTNAAAVVLKRRLNAANHFDLFCGTLHGYLFRLMRTMNKQVTLIDEQEATKLLQIIAKGLGYKGTDVALQEARDKFWANPRVLGQNSDAQRVILAYASELVRENLVEYDMLLVRGLTYIKAAKDMRSIWLYVDEFQDTSDLDFAIYQALPKHQMFAVGDADQALYEWRGANPKIMLDYYDLASRHVLNINYRSSSAIITAANRLISFNKDRVPFDMVGVGGDAVPPMHKQLNNQMQHNVAVAEKISFHLRLGVDPEEIAVLCRTNDQVRDLKEHLLFMGITVADARGENVPDMSRVRTLIGLALNPKSKILQGIEAAQRGQMRKTEPPTEPKTTVQEVLKYVRNLHAFSDPMKVIIEQAEVACPNDEPHRLFEFLRNRDVATVRNGVRVGTMHWSKGQEFEVVIIANADDDVSAPTTEEERRLFYVAITRAKRYLYSFGVFERQVPFKGNRSRSTSPYIIEAQFLFDNAH